MNLNPRGFRHFTRFRTTKQDMRTQENQENTHTHTHLISSHLSLFSPQEEQLLSCPSILFSFFSFFSFFFQSRMSSGFTSHRGNPLSL